jgi:peptidoglycan DL-endopeptidase CwlO
MKRIYAAAGATMVATAMVGLIAQAPAFSAEPTTTAPAAQSTASPTPAHPMQPHHATMSRRSVESMQEALNSNGAKIAIDGIWGPKTEGALKQYQQQHGLKATGYLDHATMKQLHTTG